MAERELKKNSESESTWDNSARGPVPEPAANDKLANQPTVAGERAVAGDNASKLSLEKIDRYVILEELGSGTYGVVYRALDEVLKRNVAVKLLTRFADLHEMEAWLVEARVLASLDHVAIVPVYDVGKTPPGQPFIVSKYIDGGTLARRILQSSCTLVDSVRFISQLAQALDYLHRRGVMHRDIKPGNILTTAEGNAVLADFGLALPESGYGKGARFVGTPAYMSPEQARREGHRVDGRSDIYSLGVVFYELLTGARPFRAKNTEDLLDCIRNVEVRPPRQINEQIPRELERICLKALSKKVSDRYSTAADMVEDLLNWRESTESRAVLATQAFTGTPADSTPVSGSLDLNTVAVVPHGLRPFEAGDADFFKYLLPGARDRNGVPDSIQFWAQRILSRQPEQTFRVGVLLGPSGSGKSSLMRAGVLPIVSEGVHALYMEAKPDLLEANLLKQIWHFSPQLRDESSLREALIRFRQRPNDRQGKKLLLVIDQFEQWLNHHRDGKVTELHEALRQCDGVNVQAILLVRDDFMLGLSSFMDQIEEPLLQNQNFATVESFGIPHAKKVLSAFGRAYGVLREVLTPDQESFIDEAIEDLTRLGKLEPVQLALLSEMIKDKPWHPSTLKKLGGTQGLGVAFLEDRLAGSSSHPLLRADLPIVRRILSEMLPTDDTVIKPPACPQHELVGLLDGLASEELLCKLMNLLDTEVRLITPTSSHRTPSGSTTTSSGSTSSVEPAYQLTHDYLVPTIRKWLASLDQGSRAGRARQQLREMSNAWNAVPNNKRLPSFIEWCQIRWFTTANEWSLGERRLMRSAGARLRRFGVGIASLTIMIAFGSYYAFNELRARELAKRLVESDTSDVAALLNEIQPLRSWVAPKLDRFKIDSEPKTEATRRALHVALAQFDDQPNAARLVLDNLHRIDDSNLPSVVGYLAKRKFDDEQLILRVQKELQQRSANALPLAGLLAQRQPDIKAWPALASVISELLARKRYALINYWAELLSPVREKLLPELLALGDKSMVDATASAENLAALVAAFAKNNPAATARAIRWAPLDQLRNFVENNASPQQLSIELREGLAEAAEFRNIETASKPDPQLLKTVSEFSGQLYADSGWAEKIHWKSLPGVLESMYAQGFAPVCLRPYFIDEELFASVAWRRTEPTSEMKFVVEGISEELDAKELQHKFAEHQSSSMTMVDFANVLIPGKQRTLSESYRWIGLWHKDPARIENTSQVLTLNQNESDTTNLGLDLDRYVASRTSVHIDQRGDQLTSTLWNLAELEGSDLGYSSSRLEHGAGDLYPGYCQTDLRGHFVGTTFDRSRNWNDYYAYLRQSKRPTTQSTVQMAVRLSACGDPEAALKLLVPLAPKDYLQIPQSLRAGNERTAQRQIARSLARLGRTEELRETLEDTIFKGGFSDAEKDYFRLLMAVLDKDLDATSRLLAVLKQYADTNPAAEDYYLRALANVARQDFSTSAGELAMSSLLDRIPQSIANGGYKNWPVALLDTDFDGIRLKPAWQSLLKKLGLSIRFEACGYLTDQWESQSLQLPLARHTDAAKRLHSQGFFPVALNIFDDGGETWLAASVWHKAKESPADHSARATRISRMALALSMFDEHDALLDGLREKWGRSVQSFLITQIPRVIPADKVVTLLQQSTQPELQTALISALGGYKPSEINENSLRLAKLRLKEWSVSAPQASLVNMARWCLGVWNEPLPELPATPSPSNDRDWYVNSQDQQMIHIPEPKTVLLGRSGMDRIWVQIDRAFAISATEINGAQYAQFLKDPRIEQWISANSRERRLPTSEANFPQLITWNHAIRYCQWLNERESIPETEWCYQNVWTDGECKPHPDYLRRKGYRLPTKAEWEYVATGLCRDQFHFGSDASLTKFFEWTLPHSANRPHPIARLRPNRFGLHDMGGNLAELADNWHRPPLRPDDGYVHADLGNQYTDLSPNVYANGGRFRFEPVGASYYQLVQPNYPSASTGFRIARTMPNAKP